MSPSTRMVASYLMSALTHVAVFCGIAVWSPDQFTDATFSMASGNGGYGDVYAPIGSQGGATTSEVFYLEMPAISSAHTVEFKAPTFSELAAQERESRLRATTPVVSAMSVARQQPAEPFVSAVTQPPTAEERTPPTETPHTSLQHKPEQSTPEPPEPTETPFEPLTARNIAVAPTVNGAAALPDIAEKAAVGEIANESTALAVTKATRSESTDRSETLAASQPTIERPETPIEPSNIEVQRQLDPRTPQSPATETLENPANLPVYRSIAAAPTIGEADVELPAVTVSNGRGQEGLGTGNTQGGGNGGARGKMGGDFDSFARNGPLNRSPIYPAAAVAAGIEGVVHVWFQVAADGSVKSAAIEKSSGSQLLDEAVREAIRSWRFEPARRGGVPVECAFRVPFDFYLRRR